MALAGNKAYIKLKSSGTAMTDEATSTSDNISYQITDSNKRIIDLDTLVLVEDSAVTTTEGFTIDYLNGIITFETADAGRVITVTGAYLTPATVATAYSYSFNGSADTLENTPFNSDVRTYQAGLRTGSLSLSRYFVADSLFFGELITGDTFIIEIYVDATNKISMYGVLSSDNIEAPVEGLVEESIDFQVTTQIGV